MSNINKFSMLNDSILECCKCGLSDSRTQVVTGRGHINPSILFLGQNPGREEDEEGMAFVGMCGLLLEEWVQYLGLEETNYAITNAAKCLTPKNRKPNESEINACSFWLKQEIKLLSPKLIVTLGTVATSWFLGKEYESGILKYGGNFHKHNSKFDLFLIPHPSYFIRHGKKGKEEMWKPFLNPLVKVVDTYLG